MSEASIKPAKFSAKVAGKTHLSPDYYLVRFGLADFKFLAGQYVTFHLSPPKLRHTMSIASPPDGGYFEILQCVAPHGEGSRWTEGLSTGDAVTFTGPLGRFVIEETPRKKVFVATGCGIAPFRAIITDYLQRGGKSEIELLWGMRYEKDLFWQDEFKKLAVLYPNFHYFVTLSKPENSWGGLKGRVTDYLTAGKKDLKDSEFYLCGGSAMITAVKEQLIGQAVPEEQIFNEIFFQMPAGKKS